MGISKDKMMEANNHRHTYAKRMKHIIVGLVIEILFTLCISGVVVVNIWSGVAKEAKQYTSETIIDYQSCIENYISSFKAILIPIQDKIKENPSFDEMQKWLQSKEIEFEDAVGKGIYDGIAFTYKGGYVHSWNYGDYTNYDATTRPWYQQAEKANGEIIVVPPYVTYLGESYFADNAILITVAQKYNDEISFDLDIKISDIKALLQNSSLFYDNEKVFLYNTDGYILSSTDNKEFAHNLKQPDDILTEEYSKQILEESKDLNDLKLELVDGQLQYLYYHTDNNNTVCMILPLQEVFLNNFLVISIISILLILFEIYLFMVNRRNALEFMERDRRLNVLADRIFKERLYINIDSEEFYGNDTAGKLCKNGTYAQLYQLMTSRLIDENDLPRMEAFLGPKILHNYTNNQYKIESERFMMSMTDKDGILKEKTIEVSSFAYTEDNVHKLCISMQDAAESADLLKEALEAANQASESKGNFLSNMSHEIRTPLNAIIGYLSIAKDEECSEDKKNYCIDNCDVASKHLLQIINDILDMSSIENGKLKIAHEDFDLKKEISDITAIFFQNAKAKNIEFETHISGLSEEWVIGDQLRVNQILMNLLSNAIKFTQENGHILLKVKQLRSDSTRVYMQFTISDTGVGMSKEYMSRIFKPFEQENASTARKYGGSGLGLSITNNLIHMMGGQIEVQSEQNVGTTMVVTMYFDKSQEGHQPNLETDFSHVRVLVVDDKEDECTYIKTLLKRCGVKSDTATSGEKALKQIRRRMGSDYKYDLCIIDWKMPEMDGGEVTKKIRQELGEDMPIIIATAYDVSEFEEEAKKDGATKIVSKPLFQSTLFDLLVSTFGGYNPEGKEHKEKIDMSGIHVLLAEDNAMNMDIAVTMLEKVGIQVDQATNGQEAYNQFMQATPGTYDLILMDVQMPVMDGYEATGKIRNSSHKEAKTMPIIAMTANAFAEDVAEALSHGMNAHIAKPINYDKFFGLLKQFTNKKGKS